MLAKDNPLNTNRIESLSYRFYDDSFSSMLKRLGDLNHRAALVGPEGSGKTTLLLELKEHLEDSGIKAHLYGLKKDRKKIPWQFWFKDFEPNSIILLDGAEQLSLLEFNLLKLKTQGLKGIVITSHRSGLLPTLLECTTSIELFEELLEKLVPVDKPSRKSIEAAFKKHSGNIRMAFLELYDEFAEIHS